MAGRQPAEGALQEACAGSSNCMHVVQSLCGGRLDCIAGITKQVAATVQPLLALASLFMQGEKQGHTWPAYAVRKKGMHGLFGPCKYCVWMAEKSYCGAQQSGAAGGGGKEALLGITAGGAAA